MACKLCEAEVLGERFYEGAECWVAECGTCGVPMVVWREHGVSPPPETVSRMVGHLREAGDLTMGRGWYHLDGERRSIPDHWHVHARPRVRFRSSGRNADWVTDRLAVGGLPQAMFPGWVAKCGITDVLDLRDEINHDHAAWWAQGQGLGYTALPVPDDGWPRPESWWADGLEVADRVLAKPEGKLLVMCWLGVNRAPSMVFTILRANGWSAAEAARTVMTARPQADLRYAADGDEFVRRRSGERLVTGIPAEPVVGWRLFDPPVVFPQGRCELGPPLATVGWTRRLKLVYGSRRGPSAADSAVWTRRTHTVRCPVHPGEPCCDQFGSYACRTLEDLAGYFPFCDLAAHTVALVRSSGPAWWVGWERTRTWRSPTISIDRLLVGERTSKRTVAQLSAWFGVPVDRLLPTGHAPECWLDLAVRADAAGLPNVWRAPARRLSGGVPVWLGEMACGEPRVMPVGLAEAVADRAAGRPWRLKNLRNLTATAATLTTADMELIGLNPADREVARAKMLRVAAWGWRRSGVPVAAQSSSWGTTPVMPAPSRG